VELEGVAGAGVLGAGAAGAGVLEVVEELDDEASVDDFVDRESLR